MFILAALLVVIALVAAAAMGVGPLVSDPRGERTGILGGTGAPLAILVVALAAVVAVGFTVFGVFGLRGGSGDEAGTAGPTVTTGTPGRSAPTAPPPTTAAAPEEGAPGPREPARRPARASLGPVVTVVEGQTLGTAGADADGFPDSYPVLGTLQADTVLQVRAGGFEPFTRARARQCVTAPRTVCGNAIDVQFGEEGTAAFQYLVTDDFAEGGPARRCRAGAPPCTIVITSADGTQGAEVQSIFHDPVPPPGRIRVRPSSGLEDGQTVTVEVEDYPPGARVQAMLCAPPDATGVERCGAPGATAPLAVGPDGRGSTQLTVRPGPVGRMRVRCGPGHTCGVSVASETVFARAPVVPVTFATPAGAGYDSTRLAAGLAAAALLLGVAARLVRRTDWTPVGEEAAPEIDEAEYADLDALVAATPPEDDLDALLDRHG